MVGLSAPRSVSMVFLQIASVPLNAAQLSSVPTGSVLPKCIRVAGSHGDSASRSDRLLVYLFRDGQLENGTGNSGRSLGSPVPKCSLGNSDLPIESEQTFTFTR